MHATKSPICSFRRTSASESKILMQSRHLLIADGCQDDNISAIGLLQ